MKQPLMVSAVSFLNARPLIYNLGQSDGLAIHLFPPADCAARLTSGEADVALIPVIEYSRIREQTHLEIVPDISISSSGSVKSVELYFHKGLHEIRRVAVDARSRTSVALLQIILGEKYNVRPEIVSMSADLGSMLQEADAALIIGDTALELDVDQCLDLGEEWMDLTDGLPFVYAFWAARKGVLGNDQIRAFQDAKKSGIEHIGQIAADFAQETGSTRSPEFYASYLTDNIRYDLGSLEKESLTEFYSYCFYYGMIHEIPDLYVVGDAAFS